MKWEYDSKGICTYCKNVKMCRELIIEDSETMEQCLYLFCEECDKEIDELINSF